MSSTRLSSNVLSSTQSIIPFGQKRDITKRNKKIHKKWWEAGFQAEDSLRQLPLFLAFNEYGKRQQNVLPLPKNRQSVKESIGYLRVKWFNEKLQLLTIMSGTAFLVSQRILMVPAQCLYSQVRKRIADTLQFYPNLSKGRTVENLETVRVVNRLKPFDNMFFIKNNKIRGDIRQQMDFRYMPRIEQICLILLRDRGVASQQRSIALGTLSEYDASSAVPLTIIGYRVQASYSNQIEDKIIERKEISGYLHSLELTVKDSIPPNQITNKSVPKQQSYFHIINHTCQTQRGFSGSPILAVSQKGEEYAIGMHTHCGRSVQYREGIFFSKDLIGVIQQLQNKIAQKHQVPRQIKYYLPAQPILELASIPEEPIEIESSQQQQRGQMFEEVLSLKSTSSLSDLDFQDILAHFTLVEQENM